ncbi:MAG: class I SAM-dependent methyltransferase [Elusimicrobia bacterium]|nr:class I SAM-dependent methyltransferase [Elusimicrobiota bacterium]
MHERHGAKQPERFDPAKAAALDDPARFAYLPAEALERLLDLPRGGLLVDFGTGTGTYARALARLRPDAEIAALDEQPRMLELLRDRLAAEPRPNVRPVLSDDAGLAPLQGRADRVLALNVLHELGDDALESLARLLKPGGRALFVDWSADVERPVGPPRGHVYGPAQAKERLGRFGWTVAGEALFDYHYALVCAR